MKNKKVIHQSMHTRQQVKRSGTPHNNMNKKNDIKSTHANAFSVNKITKNNQQSNRNARVNSGLSNYKKTEPTKQINKNILGIGYQSDEYAIKVNGQKQINSHSREKPRQIRVESQQQANLFQYFNKNIVSTQINQNGMLQNRKSKTFELKRQVNVLDEILTHKQQFIKDYFKEVKSLKSQIQKQSIIRCLLPQIKTGEWIVQGFIFDDHLILRGQKRIANKPKKINQNANSDKSLDKKKLSKQKQVNIKKSYARKIEQRKIIQSQSNQIINKHEDPIFQTQQQSSVGQQFGSNPQTICQFHVRYKTLQKKYKYSSVYQKVKSSYSQFVYDRFYFEK